MMRSRTIMNVHQVSLVLLLLSLISIQSQAAETKKTASAKSAGEAKAAPAAPAAVGTINSASTAEVATIEEAASPFSASVLYKASTDFAEQVRPRTYSHLVSASVGYDLKDWVDLGLGADFFFKSIGGSISKYPEDSGFSSISPSLGKTLLQDMHFLGGKHKVSASAAGTIPMNEDSKIEGFLGAISLGPTLSSSWFDGTLTVRNSTAYSFIFNRYAYSPTSFDASAVGSYGHSISASVRIVGGLSVGAGFGVRRTRFSDGFHDFNYQNTQSISYAWNSWSLALSHLNGGYTDDGKVEAWYVDKYRRLISATLGYGF